MSSSSSPSWTLLGSTVLLRPREEADEAGLGAFLARRDLVRAPAPDPLPPGAPAVVLVARDAWGSPVGVVSLLAGEETVRLAFAVPGDDLARLREMLRLVTAALPYRSGANRVLLGPVPDAPVRQLLLELDWKETSPGNFERAVERRDRVSRAG